MSATEIITAVRNAYVIETAKPAAQSSKQDKIRCFLVHFKSEWNLTLASLSAPLCEGSGMPSSPLSCEARTWTAAAVVKPLTRTSERTQLNRPRRSREKASCHRPTSRERAVISSNLVNVCPMTGVDGRGGVVVVVVVVVVVEGRRDGGRKERSCSFLEEVVDEEAKSDA